MVVWHHDHATIFPALLVRLYNKDIKLSKMNPERQSTALDSLHATYTDSEGEEANSDEEMDKRDAPQSVESSSESSGQRTNSPRDVQDTDEKYTSRPKQQSKLVSYTSENYEDGVLSDSDESRSSDFEMQDDSNDSKGTSSSTNPPLSPISFHRSLMNLKKSEIKLPPEPQGRCSKAVQEKISELYEKKKQGKNMIAFIQQKKNFRNPSIYEKLIAYCNIDERGTNYPPEIYDPHCWGPESFYEELAKRQKEEMDRREKEKKERTKVEFISGTAKKPAAEPPSDPNKRKSKWDVGISQVSSTLKPAMLITPSVLPVATGTKPTVISAFGTITKKPKQ